MRARSAAKKRRSRSLHSASRTPSTTSNRWFEPRVAPDRVERLHGARLWVRAAVDDAGDSRERRAHLRTSRTAPASRRRVAPSSLQSAHARGAARDARSSLRAPSDPRAPLCRFGRAPSPRRRRRRRRIRPAPRHRPRRPPPRGPLSSSRVVGSLTGSSKNLDGSDGARLPSASVDHVAARPGRFERPTPGSVDQCSIQLSYGRLSPSGARDDTRGSADCQRQQSPPPRAASRVLERRARHGSPPPVTPQTFPDPPRSMTGPPSLAPRQRMTLRLLL